MCYHCFDLGKPHSMCNQQKGNGHASSNNPMGSSENRIPVYPLAHQSLSVCRYAPVSDTPNWATILLGGRTHIATVESSFTHFILYHFVVLQETCFWCWPLVRTLCAVGCQGTCWAQILRAAGGSAGPLSGWPVCNADLIGDLVCSTCDFNGDTMWCIYCNMDFRKSKLDCLQMIKWAEFTSRNVIESILVGQEWECPRS